MSKFKKYIKEETLSTNIAGYKTPTKFVYKKKSKCKKCGSIGYYDKNGNFICTVCKKIFK